ncbi:MAG TPA: AgmX/PglI C-terminal domain-containing protein [Kofleriaceae bacterium]|nr:AgmX/PglI C-terminal domain-containing protein [Kofleriaceae bacterium]
MRATVMRIVLALVGVSRGAAAQSTTSGGRSKPAIDQVMRANAGRFLACYNQVLKHDRRLAGRVVLSFAIGKSGDVVHASIASSTLDSPAVESCLVHVVLRLHFPGGDPTTVNYPFLFQPSK